MVKRGGNNCNNLHVRNNNFGIVQEFEYPDITLNRQNNMNKEIDIKLSAAN